MAKIAVNMPKEIKTNLEISARVFALKIFEKQRNISLRNEKWDQ